MRLDATPEACVWMAAGLLSYKLCDREFECDVCPLDAALRGARDLAPGALPGLPVDDHRGHGFPNDRRYTDSHLWIGGVTGPDADQRPDQGLARLGLDGFAAQLLPQPIRVVPTGARDLARGDVLCDFELPEGTLAIRSPIAARVVRNNPAIHQRPALVVESPYDAGWLVELEPRWDGASRDGLVDAEGARTRSEANTRHFRRRIAMHLLADVTTVGPCMADGGEPLINLSDILGGPTYLRILREFLR